jgi:regulator of protease activity HflC (stomatin/prohibitin superfamily)
VLVDSFVKWRIADVSRYYISTAGGTEEVANRRLGEIVKDGIKGVIARRTIQQVVAADRSEFLGEVVKIAGSNVSELGIILIDVRVKSIDLPEEVSESVFNRMRQDFARQAAQLRAEGSAVSEQTRAEAALVAGGAAAARLRCPGPQRSSAARAMRPRPTSMRAPMAAIPSSTRSIAVCRRTAVRSASRATSW